MPETTPLIKAALNLRGGAGFDVYTAPPVLSGLRAKRGKEAEIPINSLPFKAGKGVSNDEAI